jgi:hypothetical protein
MISAAAIGLAVAASGSSGSVTQSGTIALTSPPTTGTAGTALSLAGTVSPSASAVRVGLSTSSTTAPSSWVNATVSGAGWTAALTPSSAGTYYVWAQQTSATSIQAVSSAVTVSATASALTYGLISGSGNGSLTGTTLTNATAIPPTDWTSSLARNAADTRPNVLLSALGSVASCKFWFDSNNTGTTVSTTYGNGNFNGGAINFYANSSGYGTPTAAPAAPATAGTYYGKYAMYDSSNTLLGVYTTSAITVT